MTAESDVAKKLNLKPGMKVRVVAKPGGARLQAAVDAAREDRIAWLAYPKAGKLDTDLNRDILWRHMRGKGPGRAPDRARRGLERDALPAEMSSLLFLAFGGALLHAVAALGARIGPGAT